MSIQEKIYFFRQIRHAFETIGAVIPTSHYAARMMAAECARCPGPKTVLEAGAGTGSITAEIIQHIGPEDRLVVCEVNPDFAAYLRQRFDREPAFRAVRERVTVHEGSVTEIGEPATFDYIISAIPFTSCPQELTQAILDHYRRVLKPGGVLTYIEYAWIRGIKTQFMGSDSHQRSHMEAVNGILDQAIETAQFRRDMVWRNVPPAWIRHLRFSEAPLEHIARLKPLAHVHRVELGTLTVANDVVPFAVVLGLGTLLGYRQTGRVPKLMLLLLGLLAWFLRDPPRQVVPDTGAAYAACDGRVLSVEHVRDPRLGEDEWVRIAVFLSLTDVHINRTPIAGRVVQVFHEIGGYAAAYQENSASNASSYLVLEGVHGRCVVAQRAGMVARRIVNWCQVGESIAQGERFGLIRLGSRTDVYLPAEQVQVCVAPGDVVQAGTTVIARYSSDSPR